jgi:hypothetical protein
MRGAALQGDGSQGRRSGIPSPHDKEMFTMIKPSVERLTAKDPQWLRALDRKAFDTRFVSDKNDYSSEKDQQLLAWRFSRYRATAGWIFKYYQHHQETFNRLMRCILPNKTREEENEFRDDHALYA